MSSIEIKKVSITALDTDAIVNAANEGLWAGGGVCGAIFAAAGRENLQQACSQIGHCDTGSAVITPAFDLKARYIIHAVGPVWRGGRQREPKLLYGAYYRSLELALENDCSSIGFPLISAGIFGYPLQEAWRKAFDACNDFLDKHRDRSLDIVFAVLDDKIIEAGQEILRKHAAYKYMAANRIDHKKEKIQNKLTVSGRDYDAVFFHLPTEPNGFLSNWYPSPFNLDGIRFSSSEQYIMYRKCMLFGDEASARAVLATKNPEDQQAIGRTASGFIPNVWAGYCQMILFRGLAAKFTQNEDLKQQLLSTGDAYLVECARTDSIWACGIHLDRKERFDASTWKGTNILGFTLMEVRSMLADPKYAEH